MLTHVHSSAICESHGKTALPVKSAYWANDSHKQPLSSEWNMAYIAWLVKSDSWGNDSYELFFLVNQKYTLWPVKSNLQVIDFYEAILFSEKIQHNQWSLRDFYWMNFFIYLFSEWVILSLQYHQVWFSNKWFLWSASFNESKIYIVWLLPVKFESWAMTLLSQFLLVEKIK